MEFKFLANGKTTSKILLPEYVALGNKHLNLAILTPRTRGAQS